MSLFSISRRKFLQGTAAIGAIGAVGPFGAAFSPAHAAGGLKVRIDKDINSLDPGYMVGGSDIEVQKAVLPILVDYQHDASGQLGWMPSIFVESFVQRDPTHLDFKLKPGLMWTNGFGEVTAEDVKFSYERMTTSDWKGYFDPLDHVEVTDKHSGTIVLKQAFAPFILNTLCTGTGVILCKAAVEKQPDGKFSTEIPATCGPYLFKWTPKQKMEFVPNPDWTGPKPAFDMVEGLIIDEDKSAELAYEAGEVAVTQITPATLARYKSSPPADTKLQVAGALQYMWMGMNTEHPKLKDIRVRKAIQHAVDADTIIQGAYSGTTERSYGIVCPGLVGKRNASKYSYDPEKAKAMLAEAGVSGLELELKTLNVQERILASQIIQAQLAAVGVTVKITPLESGPFWDMGLESKGDTWKGLELWLMRFGTNPDPQEATQWFVGSQVGVWNWERWKDAEYDDLYNKGIAETDPAKRAEIYLRMQEIMEDTGAYVWINHEAEVFAHKTGLKPNFAPSGEMHFRLFESA